MRLIYVEANVASIGIAGQVVASRPQLALSTTASVEKAFALARRKPPDVMLINVDLDVMGPAKLIQILRANPATRACPVIALGADTAPQAAVKALEAGFFLYLAQPLQAGLLADALDFALEFSAREQAEL